MKISSSKLDIPCTLTSIKFLKDPSTRGNSNFNQNQKMKMKPILLSIKPVKGSLKDKLSNRANLVNSIGIGPMKEIKHMRTNQTSSFKTKT